MKVLFVCWANVGRSQMAAAFYNQLTGTHDASSAGTGVEWAGETLQERRDRRGGTDVIDVMKDDEAIDISSSPQTPLTEAMLGDYDYVVSMAQKDYTPEWLSKHPKYIFWEVEDPGGKDYSKTVIAKNEVKKRVQQFIAQIHP